ncbi:MAG: HAD family hydrolase [Planctomycetes bacterium]|nr:HAD family hydrolase [Planctomycetota bacterium]
MTFRLAAIDLDGTLLNSRKEVTQRSVDAVRRATERGLTVVLCTGRMVCSAQRYWEQIGLDTPIIGYNGAVVKDVARGRTLLHRPVPADVTRDVLDFLRRRDVFPLTYQDDRLFVERDTAEARSYSATYRVHYQIIDDLADFLGDGSTKILIGCAPGECSHMAIEIQRAFGDRLNVTQSEGRHVELNHPSATKASAIGFLADELGAEREEILAFGDGINDTDMLQYAGLGLAVSNAWDEAKRAADRVIGSNEDNAVAAFLDLLEL